MGGATRQPLLQRSRGGAPPFIATMRRIGEIFFIPQVAGMLTKSEVKRRGWTEGMIRHYLVLPDDTCPHPRFPSAAPIQFFSIERVETVERTEACVEAIERVRERRSVGRKSEGV